MFTITDWDHAPDHTSSSSATTWLYTDVEEDAIEGGGGCGVLRVRVSLGEKMDIGDGSVGKVVFVVTESSSARGT